MMGGFRALMDDCTRAKTQTSRTFQTTGTPLRIDNAQGKIQTEVIRINTQANIAADYYQIISNLFVVCDSGY